MLYRSLCITLSCVAFLQLTSAVFADLYINEIHLDPGGSGSDSVDEYIELRGDLANMSLENHYLIFIENEMDEFGTGDAGIVEHIFDLGIADNGNAAQLGSNGFLLLRQKFSRYTASQLNTDATDLVNAGTASGLIGYGNGATSTIGSSDLPSSGSVSFGALENSGFTAMIIRNDSGDAPALGLDLDLGNDGLDDINGQAGWSILDSIGVFSEPDETETGRLYGKVNFGVQDPIFTLPPDFVPNIEEGAEFQLLDYEVEYVGRWGNSTGQTVDDWHASNLTDNSGSGSQGIAEFADFRQSGDPHPSNDGDDATPASQPEFIESNKGVPYGTKLTDTLGSPNYITGDFNGDGYVDAADYTVWRDSKGVVFGTEQDHPAADANHDFVVDDDDYSLWVANYGSPSQASSSPNVTLFAASSVPEPSTALLVLMLTTTTSIAYRTRG